MWNPGALRRRRQSALDRLLAHADHSGDYRRPWNGVPEVWEHFGSAAALLTELHRQWRTALAGAVYVAIDAGAGDLARDVATAYAEVMRRHSSLRAILDANAEHPAVAGLLRKERRLLDAALGAVTAAA